MDVILLERVAKLGQMGDVVRVKNGFARNYLLPAGKALRATEANKVRFERDKVQLETRNLELRKEAEAVAEKLDGQSIVIIRSAGETGQLYGSAASRDVVEALSETGFAVSRQQVRLDRPVKTIGLHEIQIELHPEVDASITLNVARSHDEAERQARGEDLTGVDMYAEPEDESEAAPDLAQVFDNLDDAQEAAELAVDETDSDIDVSEESEAETEAEKSDEDGSSTR